MALQVTIKGKAKIFRLFDLQRVMNENGIDIGEFDLAQNEDIQRLYSYASEYIETGEVGAYDDLLFDLHGIDPEICEIELKNGGERTVSIDEITLQNQPVTNLLKKLERFEDGRIFFTTLTTGDAVWDFDSEIEDEKIDPMKFSLGYYDCLEEMDQYDAISTTLYDDLCDTLSTDQIRYGRRGFELRDFVLHQQRLYGQLLVVRLTRDSRVKVLERVDLGGMEYADQSWALLSDKHTDL